MKFDRKTFKPTLFVLSVLCLIATAIRLFVYWGEIETATGFFSKDSTFCIVYNVIAFVVFFLCLILSLKKGGQTVQEKATAPFEEFSQETDSMLAEDQNEKFAPSHPKNSDGEFLAAFPKKAVCWQGTLSAFATMLPGFAFLACAVAFHISGLNTSSYWLLYTLFSILSGAYFIFSGIFNSAAKNKLRPFFALLPAFWCTIRMVVEYRDLARFVNKTLYIGQFLFIISALLFFLYQAQILVGEKPLNKPNTYAFSSLSVVFLGISCRLPQLIAVFGDKVTVDLVDAASLVVDLAITFYAIIKIRTVLED